MGGGGGGQDYVAQDKLCWFYVCWVADCHLFRGKNSSVQELRKVEAGSQPAVMW